MSWGTIRSWPARLTEVGCHRAPTEIDGCLATWVGGAPRIHWPHGFPRRRHPKMLPDGVRDELMSRANTARDRMVITWLLDARFRIGELCGLHLSDLHLRSDGTCGDSRKPHVISAIDGQISTVLPRRRSIPGACRTAS